LNPFADRPGSKALRDEDTRRGEPLGTFLDSAEEFLAGRAGDLGLPFHLPLIEGLACLIPGT
jgi:hypothetical protein